jgi:D-arabinitol dehydrogenase (NADP+)
MGVYPLIPGHEMIGTIDEVCSEVSRLSPGQLVTVNPNIYCGDCDYCCAGRLGLCAYTQGMGVHRPGFFGEYVTTDHQQVFSVDGLDPDTAVFTEPTACAPHGLETLDIRPGSSALVTRRWPDRSPTCTTYCQPRRYFSHRCRPCRLQAPHCLCPRY